MITGIEKALDGVWMNAEIFNGQNITRFMRIYEDEMSFHGILNVMKVTSFSRKNHDTSGAEHYLGGVQESVIECFPPS